MKKILIVALAAAMAIGATACGTKSSENANSQKTGTVETTVTVTEEDTTVADTEVTLPSSVTVGNYIEGENLKFTFEAAKQYDEIQDPDNELLKSTPSEGKKYLVLFFEVENISSEEQNVNMFYQKAYLDDYDIDSTLLIVNPDGYGTLSGDLAVGKKLKGCVCYEVESDWQKLEFTYQDGITSNSETFDFVVTPSDLT
jgi:hypothetical protein